MVSKTEPFDISVSEYQRLTPYGRHSSCRLWRRLLVTSGVKRWPRRRATDERAGAGDRSPGRLRRIRRKPSETAPQRTHGPPGAAACLRVRFVPGHVARGGPRIV